MYTICSILNFCHNIVTMYKYKFACILLKITIYTNIQAVFIQCTQVSNYSFLFFTYALDLLFAKHQNGSCNS